MVNIPAQLWKKNLRFVLIKRGEKKPFELNWTGDVNYAFDDEKLKEHIKNNGNYGVLTGVGDLLVIDCDVPEIVDEVKKKLPETLMVQTGSGGVHFYFFCPDFEKKIIMQIGKVHYGECQWKGQQIVGPGSLHPNQNTYEVINLIYS